MYSTTLPYPIHLPVTPEIARLVIDSDETTLSDLDALIASIGNNNDMGVTDPLYLEAMARQSDMVLREYYASRLNE